VNLGGWLLLEPWITPGIFEEVNVGELQVIIMIKEKFLLKTANYEKLQPSYNNHYCFGVHF